MPELFCAAGVEFAQHELVQHRGLEQRLFVAKSFPDEDEGHDGLAMNEDFKVSDKSNDPDLNTPRIALSKLAVSREMSEDGRKEIINYLNEL